MARGNRHGPVFFFDGLKQNSRKKTQPPPSPPRTHALGEDGKVRKSIDFPRAFAKMAGKSGTDVTFASGMGKQEAARARGEI